MLALRARIVALLAAIAMMLPNGAAARAAYFCRMMERVMPSCCCSGAHAAHGARDEPRQAKAGSPDCCERVGAPNRAPAGAASDAELQVPSAALVSLLPIDVLFAAPVALGAEHASSARGPPPRARPLFIVHCSLLS